MKRVGWCVSVAGAVVFTGFLLASCGESPSSPAHSSAASTQSSDGTLTAQESGGFPGTGPSPSSGGAPPGGGTVPGGPGSGGGVPGGTGGSGAVPGGTGGGGAPPGGNPGGGSTGGGKGGGPGGGTNGGIGGSTGGGGTNGGGGDGGGGGGILNTRVCQNQPISGSGIIRSILNMAGVPVAREITAYRVDFSADVPDNSQVVGIELERFNPPVNVTRALLYGLAFAEPSLTGSDLGTGCTAGNATSFVDDDDKPFLHEGRPSYVGSFEAEQSFGMIDTFGRLNSGGQNLEWRLRISSSGSQTITINCWCLTITTKNQPS